MVDLSMFSDDGGKQILIIDEDLLAAQELSDTLADAGHENHITSYMESALEEIREGKFNLIIIDFEQIGAEGASKLSKLGEANRGTPVILLTKKLDADITVNAIKLGVVDYIIKPVNRNYLLESVSNAQAIGRKDQVSDAILGEMHQQGFRTNQDIESVLVAASNFIEAVEMKTKFFRAWSNRVCDLSIKLGMTFGMDDKELWALRAASILHDVGNYNLEGSLLEKVKLGDKEVEQLKKHAEISADIAVNLKTGREVANLIRHHHERFDGKGYPDGLAEGEIPLGSRILSIADSYVAMTSARAYRNAMSPTAAVAELKKGAGNQFDPVVLKKLIKAIEQEMDG